MKKYILPTVTVICLLVGFMVGHALSNTATAQQRFFIRNGQIYSQNSSKVDQLIDMMRQGYVDEINTDSITEDIMRDIVQKLDPHSAYIPKEDLEMVNSELSGSFSGIGVQFSIQQDTVAIIAVIAGGPCEGVGILAGDKIVTVDDSVFVGKKINNEKVMHTLRGEKGTKVKLGIKRAGTAKLLHYTVVRGDIPVTSVDAKFTIQSGKHTIGFVRVNKFAENTYREFITALSELREQGADRYIIDLRENSGGYMEQAIKMANEFLSRGDMIVYAEGRKYPRYEAKANGLGRFQSTPIVVLIDDFSASASEIFAGAMQDNDRAQIIGRRSFGKGLVQQQLPFDDGSAVRMTVARYYTPSGRCIQKPYTMGEAESYQKSFYERFEHGEQYSADSIHQDTTTYYTKQGRVVHGGGGIMPDYFVGRDTSLYTPFSNEAINLAYTYQFAYKYTDKHRKELKKITSWQDMERHLLQANWYPEFVAFCRSKDMKPEEAQVAKSRPLIERLINAYVVRNILGDPGFFPLLERDDDTTKKALEVLSK